MNVVFVESREFHGGGPERSCLPDVVYCRDV